MSNPYMPTGIYKRTVEHKKQSIKNLKGGMLNKHHSEKTKNKIKEKQKAILHPSGEKNPNWKGGKPNCLVCGKKLSIRKVKYCHQHSPVSEERKLEMKKLWQNPKYRQHMSNVHRNKKRPNISGEKSYLWKGGITPENRKIRNSIEIRLWREAVFARDNWTCQKTGIKGGKLHCHHIQNFAQFPELRFAIDNGITLSKEVHKEFHRKYGKKNNTQEQLQEFLLKK